MAHTGRPWNLLFLYTDQQRYNSLAAYGNTWLQMPNLNRLASQAVVFEQAYCTQPVCTPSRAAIHSGQWPHTNGVVNNNIDLRPQTRCLPEIVRGDWATGHFGKWHLGDEIYAQHGFAEWRGIDDTYFPFYTDGRDKVNDRSSYHHWLIAQGVRPWTRNPALPADDGGYPLRGLTLTSCPNMHVAPPEQRKHFDVNRFSREQITGLPEEYCKPAYLAGEAVDFLRRHQRDRFALYVNFFEPHHPNHSPRDGQYDPARVQLPANFSHLPDETVPLGAAEFARTHLREPFDGDPVSTEADVRAWIARYWGMCSLVDTHIGRILASLEELHLAENTLVFLTTDHGEMLGEHRLFGKGVMYEPSIRVPMLMRLPGQRQMRRVSGRVSQIDVLPTLLDYLGQERPDDLQGQSLRPEIERGVARRDVVSCWNPHPSHTGRKSEAARTLLTPEGWKLTLSSLGRHELRNLNEDPLEVGNLLLQNPGHPMAADLRRRLAAWQQGAGDEAFDAMAV